MSTELEQELEVRAKAIQTDGKVEMDRLRPMFEQKTEDRFALARELYSPGRRFRVVREGVRLEGIVSFGTTSWAGYAKPLAVGDIVTCNGWRQGMNSEVQEANFTADGVPWNALWCQVWPQESLWSPWPLAGFLEPIEDNEEEDSNG